MAFIDSKSSHFNLLLAKLQTADYFEFNSLFTGFDDIDFQNEIQFIWLKYFQLSLSHTH